MTSYYPNKPEADMAIKLMAVLQNTMQYEFGWLLTGMRHRVEHIDPKFRKEAQARVDAAVQGVLLVYLFAIFDEYTTHVMRGEWINTEDKTLLRAYRHIRNSVAHCHEGKRAPTCKWRVDFEAVMTSSRPFPNLLWDASTDTFDLTSSQVAHDCHAFMSHLAKRLAGHLLNDTRPQGPST